MLNLLSKKCNLHNTKLLRKMNKKLTGSLNNLDNVNHQIEFLIVIFKLLNL